MRRRSRPSRRIRAERIFLDANVLYSAAYIEQSKLGNLWRLGGELLSSAYAIEEARRNLAHDRPEALSRFVRMLEDIEIAPEPAESILPESVRLAEKDRPILAAAIHSLSNYLITGDRTHFGDFYGKSIQGVLIVPPADYFRIRKRRS